MNTSTSTPTATSTGKLFDIISKLRNKGIDVNNTANAVTSAEDFESDQAGYEQLMFEVTGTLTRTGFEAQAKQYFINFVNEAISQYSRTDDIDQVTAERNAKQGTEMYFSVMSSKIPAGKVVEWKTASRTEVLALIAQHRAEYVRPVSKQARAIDIVKANPAASSRQLQDMFIDQLKLTPNGAATYLYNIRKILKASV